MIILRIIHILIWMMEVTLELYDLVVIQSNTQFKYIPLKILATGRLISKTLIKYNNNDLGKRWGREGVN